MRRTSSPMISGRLDTWSERPAIVLVLETDDGVAWLHDRLRELARGEVGDIVDVHRVRGVALESVDALRLAVSDVSPEVALVGSPEGGYSWTCDARGWAAIADLLEPFLAGRRGHQYLHHAFGSVGEADVVISRGEGAAESEPEQAALEPSTEPIEQSKEEEMSKAKTEETVEVVEPPSPQAAVAGDAEVGPGAESDVPRTRIFGVTILCTDLARSSAFYSAVLGLEPHDTAPGRAFFSAGGARIVLVESGGAAPSEVFFAADTLEETHERLASQGASPSEISVSWSGERWFGCSDPDGNRLWFVDAQTIRLPAA